MTGSTPGLNLVPNHAYPIVGFNSGTGQYQLYNPWGMGNSQDGGLINLTYQQISSNSIAYVST
jgi:hypothetical protein